MATWAEANARANKSPVVLVTVGTTRYSSGTIQAPTAAASAIISKVGSVGGSVQPHAGRTQIRSFSFGLIDKDGDVTSWLTTERRGSEVLVQLGYSDVDEADYLTLYRGIVTGYSWQKGVWTFACADLRRTVKKSVFTAATEAAPVSITDENPIDIVLSILTSTGAGTNGGYDTYDAANGLGIDETLIDVAAFEAIRDDDFATESWSYTIEESEDALDWIEREVCKVLGIYLVTLSTGALSLRQVKPPLFADAPIALAKSNIIDVSMSHDLNDLVNEVKWAYDWDVATSEYLSDSIYLDSDSLTAYATSKTLEIESNALDESLSDGLIADRVAGVFSRYSAPFPRYKVTAFLAVNQIDEGTIVALSHPNLPDIYGGGRGIAATSPLLCEVLSVSVSPLDGKVTMDLIGTPWNYGRKYARISAAGTTDYDTKDESFHSKYAFIGDVTTNYVGAADEDGYVIYPG